MWRARQSGGEWRRSSVVDTDLSDRVDDVFTTRDFILMLQVAVAVLGCICVVTVLVVLWNFRCSVHFVLVSRWCRFWKTFFVLLLFRCRFWIDSFASSSQTAISNSPIKFIFRRQRGRSKVKKLKCGGRGESFHNSHILVM